MLRRASLFLFSLLASAVAQAGWQSLGPNPTVTVRPDGLALTDGKTSVLITAASPDIFRVRYAPVAVLPADRSFAVVTPKPEPVTVQVRRHEGYSELDTGRLKARIEHAPFAIEFLAVDGRSLDRDDKARGTAHADGAVRVWKRLRDDEHVYGFGEKTGRLNKRGWNLGGYHTVMWNSDTFAYDSSTDPLYVSVPFFMVLRQGLAHGIFLDNSFRSSFDVGRDSRNVLSFGADGGELDYYFINGPEPKDVIQRYTALTGRMPLPPRWSLGFHQSRWSYFPEARLRLLADTFRSKQIPADTLWLDIDYLEGFTPFVWNRQYFPEPAKLIGDLKQQGFQIVTIVDPHPKKQPGYHVYDQGVAGNHFVRNADGSVFEGPVWPINAKQNPANSVFPDFTRAATRDWWGGLHRELVEQGVAGIWNDMNEPAVWIPPANTMPLDVQHENDGAPTDQREIHNVYGMLHNRATFEGLLKLNPQARPFVLTRATFAGGQRYAAVWPGDNTADWASLRQSLPTLMGLGLSGFPFVGADIGGFAGTPSGELFTRWLQAAVFSPFMRAHTEQATPDQEPWSYGSQFEAINRRTIELRYQLLPHLYNVMEEASRTGVPALRPLLLEYPADPNVWARDDEYLLGADLLVAPVLSEAAQTREVYLPAGQWFELSSGKAYAGGHHKLAVTLDSLPVFVRAGAFLFRQPTIQHTGQMRGAPLQVALYPATESQASFYEDDGETHAYRTGEFRRRVFHQQRDGKRLTVQVRAGEGRYQPAARALELHLVAEPLPRELHYNGKKLAALDAERWHAGESGWIHEQGQLRVRVADAMEDHRFLIRRGSVAQP
ncbi:MAG: glycoside hydrolase family 31 protein [Pseudomonadota bacterium]